MFMFIKMSSGWYGAPFDFDSEENVENLQEHANNGNIVCIVDDIATFADEMDIDGDDIEMVE